MNTDPHNSRGDLGVLVNIIILLVGIGIGYMVGHASPIAVTSETNPEIQNLIYTDGTYSAIGNYNSPGGAETIGVSLVLKDDIITSATVTAQATRPQSKMFQDMFIGAFASQVVGKNIADLNLSKISGSSLTPKGFNDAVAKIKAQAKA